MKVYSTLTHFFEDCFNRSGKIDTADFYDVDFLVQPVEDEDIDFVAGRLDRDRAHLAIWSSDKLLIKGYSTVGTHKIKSKRDAATAAAKVIRAILADARLACGSLERKLIVDTLYYGPSINVSLTKPSSLVPIAEANNTLVYNTVVDLFPPELSRLLKRTSIRLNHINLVTTPPQNRQGYTLDIVPHAEKYAAVMGYILDVPWFIEMWGQQKNFHDALENYFNLKKEGRRVVSLVATAPRMFPKNVYFSSVLCTIGALPDVFLKGITTSEEADNLWEAIYSLLTTVTFDVFTADEENESIKEERRNEIGTLTALILLSGGGVQPGGI